MTVEEELRTAYANLKGHQERSIGYIRRIDELAAEIRRLEAENRELKAALSNREAAK